MADYTYTDRILRYVMVGGLIAVAIMHLALMSYISVQPKAVLKAIDERLEVTPRQVMERLDAIEKAHMRFVEEHREVK